VGGGQKAPDTRARMDKWADGQMDRHTHKAKPIRSRYAGCNQCQSVFTYT